MYRIKIYKNFDAETGIFFPLTKIIFLRLVKDEAYCSLAITA